jgi:hypothetical protein
MSFRGSDSYRWQTWIIRNPFLDGVTSSQSIATRARTPHSMCEVWNLKSSNGYDDLNSSDVLGNLIAISALCCLWLGLVTYGWARWGSVSVDSGREIYVAAALAQGKMLYRDVWYPYHPGAPYLNALLFRIFGIHITVAYLAGALAGLAVALTLFRCALYFVPLPVAFAVGYMVLIQSFGPGIFNYPLPYSYAAVYGSVAASWFLLFAIRAALKPTKTTIFWAAFSSAVALLMKLEYGLACFATLAALQLGLVVRQRSSDTARGNFLATIPALLVCAVVVGWMVSIHGVTFLTQENFMSWPTSYFMRIYGQFWLGGMGFELSLRKVLSALLATVGFVIFWTGFRFWLLSALRDLSFRHAGLAIALATGAIACSLTYPEWSNLTIATVLFPRPMVFMVGLTIPVAAFLFWRSQWQARNLAILILATFGPLLAFRMLFGMLPHAYAIFYNGPLVLAFCCVLLSVAIPGNGRDPRGQKALLFVCAALCTWVTAQVYPDYNEMRKGRLALKTERGTIFLPETMLPAWPQAVDFMRHDTGGAVMTIPEDTALYFFSGVLCPVRVCIFTPGLVAPGRMMDQVIEEIRQARVRYIIWSNRKFYEYDAPEFGLDFDRPLGEYIRSHYQPIREFGPSKRPDLWHATLWERK